MANLYDKAGLVNIPVGYQEGFLYNIKPEDNTLGFRFNRDSAATLVNSKGLIEQVGYFGPELVKNGNFSELGPELVVNGDFATDSDWALVGSNVFISNNKLNFVNATTNSEFAQQFIVAPIGKTYKITLEVSNLGSGESIKIRHPFQDTTINTNGFHTIYGVGDLANLLRITPNSTTATFSIDNVSVKQVDPNDYWTIQSGWSFGNNKIISGGTGIFRPTTNSWTSGGKFLFKLKISDRTSGYIRIQNPAVTVYYVNNIDKNGELEFIFDSIDNTGWAIEAQGGFNGSITDISVTEILGDKPRIDYTDSLTSPSFLLEPQSTNLLTFSEDFSQWTNYSQGTGSLVTLTSNYSISPDGTKNASRIQCALNGGNTSSDRSYIKLSGFSGTPFTCAKSLYVKNNLNVQQTFFIGVNAVSDRVTLPVSNKWQRLKVEGGVLNTEFRIGIIGGSLNSDSIDIDIFAAQIETLSYATSYIPTAGSTVTRAQETCIGAGSASTFNSTEGVLYAEIAELANDGQTRRITLSDGTPNNRITIMFISVDNTIEGFVVSNNSTQYYFGEVLSDTSIFNKIAVKWKQNYFSVWINGVEYDIDTSGNVPVGLNELSFDNGYGANFFYGKTKGIYVFNEALTDDELQQLTGPEYNSFAALAAAYNYTVI